MVEVPGRVSESGPDYEAPAEAAENAPVDVVEDSAPADTAENAPDVVKASAPVSVPARADTGAPDDPEVPSDGENDLDYTLYTRRWMMLAMFSVPSAVNGMLFLSIAAVTDATLETFDVSVDLVNALGQVFYVVFLVVLPTGLVILGKESGLREATIMAGVLNTVGSGLRIPSTLVSSKPLGFSLLITGNIIAAASQPYFLVVPPLISAKWFGENEQGIATGIAALANQFGMALGYFLARFFIDIDNYDTALLRMNATIFGFTLLVTVAAYFKFEDHPPTLPAARPVEVDKEKEVKLSYLETVKQAWVQIKEHATPSFVFITIGFGCVVAIYWNLGLLLDGTMTGRFTTDEIAVSGCCLMSAGIPGMYFAGLIMDRTGMEFKFTIMTTLILAGVSLVGLTLLLGHPDELAGVGISADSDWKPPTSVVYIVCIVLGLFLSGLQPMLLQLATHLTYPLSEEISSSVMFLSATQIAFVLVFVSNGFTWGGYSAEKGSFLTNVIYSGLLLCFMISYILVNNKLVVKQKKEVPGEIN